MLAVLRFAGRSLLLALEKPLPFAPVNSLHCLFSFLSLTPMSQGPRTFHREQEHIRGFSEQGLGKAWVGTGLPNTTSSLISLSFPKYSYSLCLLL